jgi:hypothetical protein
VFLLRLLRPKGEVALGRYAASLLGTENGADGSTLLQRKGLLRSAQRAVPLEELVGLQQKLLDELRGTKVTRRIREGPGILYPKNCQFFPQLGDRP